MAKIAKLHRSHLRKHDFQYSVGFNGPFCSHLEMQKLDFSNGKDTFFLMFSFAADAMAEVIDFQ